MVNLFTQNLILWGTIVYTIIFSGALVYTEVSDNALEEIEAEDQEAYTQLRQPKGEWWWWRWLWWWWQRQWWRSIRPRGLYLLSITLILSWDILRITCDDNDENVNSLKMWLYFTQCLVFMRKISTCLRIIVSLLILCVHPYICFLWCAMYNV